MSRFETRKRNNEILLIPTIGWVKQMNYITGKKRVNILFAWLHIRTLVLIWESKGYFYKEGDAKDD